MGDMADYYVDLALDTGEGFAQCCRKPLKCNYCGSTAVQWRETEHGWRLFDDKRQHPGNRYVEHDCQPQPTADGFDEVE